MQKPITERQKALLRVIFDFLRDSGYPPTYEEMRQNLGVASNQSVVDLLEKLRKGGYIKKESGARSLAVTRLGYQILGKPALAPILGTTTAGLPAEAIEIRGEWRQVSDHVAVLSGELFMLKISGDSMINAGIDDGDMVLVQSKSEFMSGEIVYAEMDSGGTVKRFMSINKPPYVYLKPENPKYENILFSDDVLLKGKVVSVLKGNSWEGVK